VICDSHFYYLLDAHGVYYAILIYHFILYKIFG
jgi:hypothetical protein